MKWFHKSISHSIACPLLLFFSFRQTPLKEVKGMRNGSQPNKESGDKKSLCVVPQVLVVEGANALGQVCVI